MIQVLWATLLAAVALDAAPEAHIRKQGQMRVDAHCAVNLDEGKSECMITLDVTLQIMWRRTLRAIWHGRPSWNWVAPVTAKPLRGEP